MNDDVLGIIDLMKQIYDTDLLVYDSNFLLATINRRIYEISLMDSSDYANLLVLDPNEATHFIRALQITYSQFFREPLTFAFLENTILPSLLANKLHHNEIRIWSAGCASGQEAYSLAMLLSELTEGHTPKIRFRIFATDISIAALKVAETGNYNHNAVQNVKMKYIDKYFSKQDDIYSIVPEIKNHVVFSSYDMLDFMTMNPPESIYGDFDLILCCNLLIYYKPMVQKMIIRKLQSNLSTNGYFITGEVEKAIVGYEPNLQTIQSPTAIFRHEKRRLNL